MCTSRGQERVGRAHDRADVEVVLPVLDGDVEVVAPGVEVGDDRLHRPVAVAVDHVAPVSVRQQVRVVLLPRRQRSRPTGPTPTSSGPCGIGSYGAALPGSSGRPRDRTLGSNSGLTAARVERHGSVRPSRIRSLSDKPAADALRPRLDGPELAAQTSSVAWFFWVSLVIIVVECGLFFPFLPGDSLLFAMGLFIAGGKIEIIPGGHVANLRVRARGAVARRVRRQRHRLRDRALDRAAALRAGRADPQAQVLRPDLGVLRQARQQGPGDRPVRAVRAHLHHRGRRA